MKVPSLAGFVVLTGLLAMGLKEETKESLPLAEREALEQLEEKLGAATELQLEEQIAKYWSEIELDLELRISNRALPIAIEPEPRSVPQAKTSQTKPFTV